MKRRFLNSLLAALSLVAAISAKAAPLQVLEAYNNQIQTPAVSFRLNGSYLIPDPRITCTRTGPSLDYIAYDYTVESLAPNTCAYPIYGSNAGNIGWVIAGPRTNYIVNNVWSGLVAGSPGTIPTNVGAGTSSANGITRTISAVTTENGWELYTVRWNGTPTNTSTLQTLFTTTSGGVTPVAASGQQWACSVFVKLVAGSFNNISSAIITVNERNSAGTSLVQTSQTFLNVPTIGQPIIANQIIASRLFNQATTAYATCQIQLGYTTGQPIDITLAYARPQLSENAYPQGGLVSKTTGSAVAIGGDVVTMPLNKFNIADGTNRITVRLKSQLKMNTSTAREANTEQTILSLSDGTMNNYFTVYQSQLSNGSLGYKLVNGGVTISAVDAVYPGSSIPTFATRNRVISFSNNCFGYAADDWGTDAGVTLPHIYCIPFTAPNTAKFTTLNIGSLPDGSKIGNWWIQNFDVWPWAVNDNNLLSLTQATR